jgi:hypothetical protein
MMSSSAVSVTSIVVSAARENLNALVFNEYRSHLLGREWGERYATFCMLPAAYQPMMQRYLSA